LISRPVYYRLAKLVTRGPAGYGGVWSNGRFFPLE
jgi:hypothetical protein